MRSKFNFEIYILHNIFISSVWFNRLQDVKFSCIVNLVCGHLLGPLECGSSRHKAATYTGYRKDGKECRIQSSHERDSSQ
jgi:hypothetical protein